jgi:adenylate cyclase class IV
LEQPRTYAGIEVNDEREFNIRPEEGAGGGSGRKGEIEPPDRGLRAFEELLRRLGLRPALSKRKRGWAWDCGEIRAELSHVESLGWFIELEILREPEPPAGEGDSPGNPGGSTDQDAMAACRDKLLALLDRLEIPRSRIESRPYTRMLAGIRPR